MASPDDENRVVRPLLTGLGALVGGALLIGGVVSLVALGAVRVLGVGDPGGLPAADPSLYMPSPTSSSPAAPTDTPRATPRRAEPTTGAPRPPRRQILLTTDDPQVGGFERIDLSGRYRGRREATLQVQRFEGRWVDFPVTTTVRDGRFATYVLTSRVGRNRFRMLDEATGRASNPVTVQVG